MKNILLFLLFLFIGLAILLGYDYLIPNNFSKNALGQTFETQFSLNNAPNLSLQGTIASMSGQVDWLSRTATKPIQLRSPRLIQQGEEISTGANGKTDIVIKNYSALSLFPNTQINFIQLLPINFVVEQDKGTVVYQNTLHIPISIKTFDLITFMTNGVIAISVDPMNNMVTITVMKGNISEGYRDTQDTSNVITVDAGQQFIFDDTARTETITGKVVNTPSFSTH